MKVHNPKSLKEICKIAVIKGRSQRECLPKTLIKEVDELDDKIRSTFSGTFHRYEDWSFTTLTINWTNGQWELTLRNQRTLVVKSGMKNALGKLGCDIFSLRGRSVSITDFNIDFHSHDYGCPKLCFVGTCSNDIPGERAVKIELNFEERLESMAGSVVKMFMVTTKQYQYHPSLQNYQIDRVVLTHFATNPSILYDEFEEFDSSGSESESDFDSSLDLESE